MCFLFPVGNSIKRLFVSLESRHHGGVHALGVIFFCLSIHRSWQLGNINDTINSPPPLTPTWNLHCSHGCAGIGGIPGFWQPQKYSPPMLLGGVAGLPRSHAELYLI